MQSVLVLISNEAERAVTGEAVGVALETVPATTEPRWLNPAVACEIALDGAVEETVAARARDNLAKLAVDAAVLPARGRRKSVLLADMDSTIIGQECIDELGAMSGLGDRIANITTRAMRGELDFADALRERVGLMEGLPASAIEQALAERITLNQGARTLVRTMKQHGAYTALVSGGFTAFTSRIANEAGFDEHRGKRTRPCRRHTDGPGCRACSWSQRQSRCDARDLCATRDHAAGRDRGRRRGERPGHAGGSRHGCRNPRQAGGRGGRSHSHRPRRSHPRCSTCKATTWTSSPVRRLRLPAEAIAVAQRETAGQDRPFHEVFRAKALFLALQPER